MESSECQQPNLPKPRNGSSAVVGPTYLTVISLWMVETSLVQHRRTGKTLCQSPKGQHSHHNSPAASPAPISQICSPKHHPKAF